MIVDIQAGFGLIIKILMRHFGQFFRLNGMCLFKTNIN